MEAEILYKKTQATELGFVHNAVGSHHESRAKGLPGMLTLKIPKKHEHKHTTNNDACHNAIRHPMDLVQNCIVSQHCMCNNETNRLGSFGHNCQCVCANQGTFTAPPTSSARARPKKGLRAMMFYFTMTRMFRAGLCGLRESTMAIRQTCPQLTKNLLSMENSNLAR